MIFRQFFERESCTFTYLIAERIGGEALLIDPVLSEVDQYLRALEELELKLVFAVDTHVHADHITGLGKLRDSSGCATIMGQQSRADCVSQKVRDGELLSVDGLQVEARYTPGHTDDSYSFLLKDRVFTGDTLLIRGTGRTDFQNGDARAQYDSLFNNLLTLPEATTVFPAHDYKGWTSSTIGEEIKHNPRLQVTNVEQYVEIMQGLNLPKPKLLHVAVPANLGCGMVPDLVERKAESFPMETSVQEAHERLDQYRLIDVREPSEFVGELGHIENASLVPLGTVENASADWNKKDVLLMICRSGRRSGRATKALREAGFEAATNLTGGMIAWNEAGYPVTVELEEEEHE